MVTVEEVHLLWCLAVVCASNAQLSTDVESPCKDLASCCCCCCDMRVFVSLCVCLIQLCCCCWLCSSAFPLSPSSLFVPFFVCCVLNKHISPSVCQSPHAISTTRRPLSDFTCVAPSWSLLSPCPSCPKQLLPHVKRSPFSALTLSDHRTVCGALTINCSCVSASTCDGDDVLSSECCHLCWCVSLCSVTHSKLTKEIPAPSEESARVCQCNHHQMDDG